VKIDYKSLSIIGMQKNAGKTTCLNSILEHNSNLTIGLTSIGRDGEKEDSVYKVSKPSIFVNKGTLVATTDDCLKNSSCEYSILHKTNINTPLGVVYIIKVTTAGFIDLAGPSFNKQINEVKEYMGDVDLFIVDGAFSRKQMASNEELEATILVTGASYSKDIDEVVRETVVTYDLLNLPKGNLKESYFDSAVTLIGDTVRTLDLNTSLGSAEEIVNEIDSKVTDIVLSGALTEELVDELKHNRHRIKDITIHIKDGTKAFLRYDFYQYLKKMNISLRVLHSINLIALVYNPYSPLGYEFDDEEFKEKLSKHIDIPIINVLRKGRDSDE